jgi:hypothetical protein
MKVFPKKKRQYKLGSFGNTEKGLKYFRIDRGKYEEEKFLQALNIPPLAHTLRNFGGGKKFLLLKNNTIQST